VGHPPMQRGGSSPKENTNKAKILTPNLEGDAGRLQSKNGNQVLEKAGVSWFLKEKEESRQSSRKGRGLSEEAEARRSFNLQ